MVSHKFIYIAAESAQSVIVTGTFDEWKANAQMESKGAGKWEKAIEITPGEVMYKFGIDMLNPCSAHVCLRYLFHSCRRTMGDRRRSTNKE